MVFGRSNGNAEVQFQTDDRHADSSVREHTPVVIHLSVNGGQQGAAVKYIFLGERRSFSESVLCLPFPRERRKKKTPSFCNEYSI